MYLFKEKKLHLNNLFTPSEIGSNYILNFFQDFKVLNKNSYFVFYF